MMLRKISSLAPEELDSLYPSASAISLYRKMNQEKDEKQNRTIYRLVARNIKNVKYVFKKQIILYFAGFHRRIEHVLWTFQKHKIYHSRRKSPLAHSADTRIIAGSSSRYQTSHPRVTSATTAFSLSAKKKAINHCC